MIKNDHQMLADWLQQSRSTVILTGAGMSTESGVPDFRSPSGWWRQINPETIANPTAMKANYDQFHGFYMNRLDALVDVKPNSGHYLIADWQKRNLISAVITQNVDGLHTDAGTEDLVELHGTIRTFRCHACGAPATEAEFRAKQNCSSCGVSERLRANIVMYEESMPKLQIEQAYELATTANVLIVIGSSMTVYPANLLPFQCSEKIVLINNELAELYNPISKKYQQWDLFLEGKAGDILTEVNRLLP